MQLTPRQFVEMLVEECPSYDEAREDCPLASFRSEPNIAKRRERLATMSDDEVDQLYQQHLSCVCRVCGLADA